MPAGTERADLQVGLGDEGGGVICSGAPDLVVRDELAHDLAAAHRRGAVVDGDVFAVKGDGGGGRWAGRAARGHLPA